MFNIFLLFCQNGHFIRCIQPNNEKQCGVFNEDMVLKQLNTTSTMAYAQFMCFGYPKRIALEELIKKCQPIEARFKSFERSTLYSKILLSRGFKLENFRIGKEIIFFRSTQFSLLQDLLRDLEESPENTIKQIKAALARSLWRYIASPGISIFSRSIHSLFQ